MSVGLVGDPAVLAGAESALNAMERDSRRLGSADLGSVDRAIVAAPCGEDVFEVATERFSSQHRTAGGADSAWVAVEIGGLGGRSEDIEAAITGFSPGTGCYDCLRARRQSTVGSGDGASETAVGGQRSDDGTSGGLDPIDAHLAGVLATARLDPDPNPEAPKALTTTVEIPHRERQWLPVPTCQRCGELPDRSLPLTAADRTLAESITRGERAVDERLGILPVVGERESFPAPYYVAQTADTTPFSDVDAAAFAAGVDADWNPAFMKALGEGLERYCAGVYRTEWFRTETAQSLASRTDAIVLDTSQFVRDHSPTTSGSDSPATRHWIAGRDLIEERTVYIPADRVQFPSPGDAGTTTTGLALGTGTVDAIRGGLNEIIERDATMCSWYSTIDPVGVETDDAGVETLTKRARSEGLTVSLSLSTCDIDVPVVTAAVFREDPWPRLAVGSGGALDPNAAARSALAEAVQNWMELREMGREVAREEEPTLVRYADDPNLASELLDPETAVDADRLVDGRPRDGEQALTTLVDRVSAVGLTPAAARITTSDVGALGFEAVRVVVPGAQPLFVGEPAFGERARSVPEGFGAEPRLDREHHPYP